MRIISWNTFGFRSAFPSFQMMLQDWKPDIVCLQETKIRDKDANFIIDGYQQFWNEADDFGHLGIAIISRHELITSVQYDLSDGNNQKGNIIIAELKHQYIVCVYVPYAGKDITTRAYRHSWYKSFKSLIHQLRQKKPCILCGDFNIVQQDIDAFDNKSKKNMACFSQQEHEEIEELMKEEEVVDVYRYLYPHKQSEGFTYFPFGDKYKKNKEGYRIDLFLTDKKEINKVVDCHPLQEIEGSCNVPLLLDIKI